MTVDTTPTPSPAPVAGAGAPGPNRVGPLLVILGLLVLVRIAFAATYSANVGGDGNNYLQMMASGRSNLVHAGGYPLLARHPLHWLSPSSPSPRTLQQGLDRLAALQQAAALAALVLLASTVRRFFGSFAAGLFLTLAGLHVGFLAATHSIYPEWLQAALVCVLVALSLRASASERTAHRTLLVAAAAFVGAVAYLVKYNSLPWLLFPLVLVALDRRPLREKAMQAAVAAALFLGTVEAYRHFHHLPTTGARRLSYDKAWVLLASLKEVVPGDRPAAEAGLDSKRLLLLNALLPWENANAFAFGSVTSVSPRSAEYRSRYAWILTADEASVDAMLAKTPPSPTWDWHHAFSPTTWCLGLEEGDALGVRVWFEQVRAFPGRFLAKTLSHAWEAATKRRNWYEGFPFPVVSDLSEPCFLPLSANHVRYSDACAQRIWPYTLVWNPAGYRVWSPGANVFLGACRAVALVPVWLCSLLLAAGVPLAALLARRGHITPWSARVHVTLVLFVAGFVVASCAIYLYRPQKEHVSILPMICLSLALATDRVRLAMAARPPRPR